MVDSSSQNPFPEPDKAALLIAAYAELADLLTQGSDVVTFLQAVADTSAQVATEPAACGITLRRGREISTVAASGLLATQVDQIQYEFNQGPCLESMKINAVVEVPDLGVEHRWEEYRIHASAHGVRSSLSVPLAVGGDAVGAVNLYSPVTNHFPEPTARLVKVFAKQASTLLSVVLRQAREAQIGEQMQEALLTRAVIDQAMGIVMGQQRCTGSEAFAVLRQASQERNVKLVDVAADLIRSVTGHPPQAGRPFSQRG